MGRGEEGEQEEGRQASQEDASVADGSAQCISNLPPGRMMEEAPSPSLSPLFNLDIQVYIKQ